MDLTNFESFSSCELKKIESGLWKIVNQWTDGNETFTLV